jgi:hypothetical protein
MADIQQTIRPLTNRTDLMYSLFVSGLLCAVRQPLYRRAITVFDRSPHTRAVDEVVQLYQVWAQSCSAA